MWICKQLEWYNSFNRYVRKKFEIFLNLHKNSQEFCFLEIKNSLLSFSQIYISLKKEIFLFFLVEKEDKIRNKFWITKKRFLLMVKRSLLRIRKRFVSLRNEKLLIDSITPWCRVYELIRYGGVSQSWNYGVESYLDTFLYNRTREHKASFSAGINLRNFDGLPWPCSFLFK